MDIFGKYGWALKEFIDLLKLSLTGFNLFLDCNQNLLIPKNHMVL